MTLLTEREQACLEALHARFTDRGAMLTWFRASDAQLDLGVALGRGRWLTWSLSRLQIATMALSIDAHAEIVVGSIMATGEQMHLPMFPLIGRELAALMMALATAGPMLVEEITGSGDGTVFCKVVHSAGLHHVAAVNLAYLSMSEAVRAEYTAQIVEFFSGCFEHVLVYHGGGDTVH